jgi:hypothetical protein
MAFAWKMLIPLALISIVAVATELYLWRELEWGNDVLIGFGAVNYALAIVLVVAFFRIMTNRLYRLPRRVRLAHEIGVPSLPAPGALTQ